MNPPNRKKRLGIGLSELLGENDGMYALAPQGNLAVADVKQPFATLALEQIMPFSAQPRQSFNMAQLEEMAQSIRQMGVLQPLLVAPHTDENNGTIKYRILAGERRWRAAQLAQIDQVPCIIRYDAITPRQQMLIALIENIQRVDLNPIEEAEAYQSLVESGLQHEEISVTVGKSRSHVSNIMRLLRLPSAVKQALIDGKISLGHAKILVATENAEQFLEVLSSKDLSVRQLEKIVQHPKTSSHAHVKIVDIGHTLPDVISDVDVQALQNELCAMLGTPVLIKHHPSGCGSLQIIYKNCDQLEEICHRLQNAPPFD